MERILIPLDGSRRAEGALVHLREHLKRVDADVLLLLVSTPDARVARQSYDYLGGIERRLAEYGLHASSLVWVGEPAEAILEIAARERVSLVAMTTHGRTGVRRWVFGSVAEKVLRSSPVPVLLVRSFPSEGEREPRFRRILVPLDGTPFAHAVLAPAISLARRHDADMVLVHVMEKMRPGEERETPRKPLDAPADFFAREGVVAAKVFRCGDPALEILQSARECGADLIAMSTHGRSGVRRWVLGSVTEKILRAAPLPMLVVKGEPVTIPPATEEVRAARC